MADNPGLSEIDVSFERPPIDAWVAAAEAALRGRSLDSLTYSGPDAIAIEPLYTAESTPTTSTLPGTGDHRRGATAAATRAGWDIRQQLDARRSDINERILQNLEKGATSIALVNAPTDRSRLEAILEGVYLDMAGVHLDGASAATMIEIWRSRDLGQMPIGSLGIDPIGRLARTGTLQASIDDELRHMSDLAFEVNDMPMVVPIRVDGRIYGEAGAGPATEIACMLSTAVAYLRKLTAEGRAVDEAVHDLSFSMSVDTDQFTSIAKLRAARICWARIVEASGGNERGMRIHAQTSASMLTAIDPWVNMLRTTVAAFAAAVGGAKAITVAPFDSAVGQPDDLGLRIARNIQLILAEESNLSAVIDPAGGSYFVESLTEQVAARAWTRFQEFESGGGIAEALMEGRLQTDLAEARADASSRVATRKSPITGVTEFPDLTEQALERSPAPPPGDRPSGGAVSCEPVGLFRPAAPFEQLRSNPPTKAVFSANLGAIASHTARAAFASNLFAVAGISMIGNDGFDSTADLVGAFETAGTDVAVICGSDAQYAELAAETAAALKAAGAAHVYLAGSPGEAESALRSAGVDEFIHVGVDIFDILTRAQQILSEEGTR